MQLSSKVLDDVRVEYIDQRDLDCDCIERMCNLASGIALLIVFISSRSDIKEVGDKIKAWLPMNTKFMMISTGGEVCKREGIASIYCTDEIGRKKMVLQSFSNRMIKNSQIFTIPLPNEDLLKNEISIEATERINMIVEELKRQKVQMTINAQDTVADLFPVADGSLCPALPAAFGGR